MSASCFICGSDSSPSPSPTSLSVSLSLVQLLIQGQDEESTRYKAHWHQKLDTYPDLRLCTPCQAVLHVFDDLLQQIRALEEQVVRIREDVLQKLEESEGREGETPELQEIRLEMIGSCRRSEGLPNFEVHVKIEAEETELEFPDPLLKFEELEEPESPNSTAADPLSVAIHPRDPLAAFVKLVRLEDDPYRGLAPPPSHQKQKPIWTKVQSWSGGRVPSWKTRKSDWPCPECGRVMTRKATMERHRLIKHGISKSKPNPTPRRGRRSRKSPENEANPVNFDEEGDQTDENGDPTPECQTGGENSTHEQKKAEDEEGWRKCKNTRICPECGRTLCHGRALRQHRLKIHGVPLPINPRAFKERPFACPLLPPTCSFRTTRKNLLVLHLRRHHGLRDGKEREKLEEIGIHIRPPPPQGPAAGKTCDQCGKVLSSSTNLRAHIASVHSAGGPRTHRPFMCELCPRTFTTAANLRMHQAAHPELNLKPYICEYEGCGKQLSTPYCLRIHVKTMHEGASRFECPEPGCEYRCWAAHVLRHHVSFQHKAERRHICGYEGCGASYGKKFDLEVHIRSKHTGERPFACDQCTKRCTRLKYLRKHKEAAHSTEERYICPVEGCGRRFRARNSLWFHSHTHETVEKRRERYRRKKEAREERQRLQEGTQSPSIVQ